MKKIISLLISAALVISTGLMSISASAEDFPQNSIPTMTSIQADNIQVQPLPNITEDTELYSVRVDIDSSTYSIITLTQLAPEAPTGISLLSIVYQEAGLSKSVAYYHNSPGATPDIYLGTLTCTAFFNYNTSMDLLYVSYQNWHYTGTATYISNMNDYPQYGGSTPSYAKAIFEYNYGIAGASNTITIKCYSNGSVS
jgi:hypothetical protein